MAMIGVFILVLPYLRRPILLASILLVAFVIVSAAVSFTESNIVERFSNSTFENRYEKWGLALGHFRESPIFGVGWVTTEASDVGGTANMHSIYLQILAETGIIGAIVFVFLIGLISLRFVRAIAQYRRDPFVSDAAYLAAALFVAALAHGVIEASAIVGTSVIGVLFPFSVSFLDRLGVIHDTEAEWWADTALASDGMAADTEGDPAHPWPLEDADANWGVSPLA